LHIFGARARGDHTADSALELALEFLEANDAVRQLRENVVAWKRELSDISGLHAVELELRSNKELVRLPLVTVYRRDSS
jgi:predicted nucleotidyltransferase